MEKDISAISKSLQSLKDEIFKNKDSFPVFQKEVHDLHKLKVDVRNLKKQDEILQSQIDELRSDLSRLPTNHDLEMVESGVTDRVIATTEKIHHRIHDIEHKMDVMGRRVELTEKTLLKIFEALIDQTESWYNLGRSILDEENPLQHKEENEKHLKEEIKELEQKTN